MLTRVTTWPRSTTRITNGKGGDVHGTRISGVGVFGVCLCRVREDVYYVVLSMLLSLVYQCLDL